MLVDGEKIVAMQLNSDRPCEMRFADGSATVVRPQRFVPQTVTREMRIALNGSWMVQRWPFAAAEEQLVRGSENPGKWEKIPQPGKVFYADPDERGEDIANWNRVTLAHIDPADGAVMKKTVAVPPEFAGRRVFLRFDAIYPAARVYVNGQAVGEHLSGLTPFEADVTEMLAAGETATIAVRLLRRHAHVQLDMPRHAMEFAGICQDCCIFAVEKCHVVDFHLKNSVAENLADAVVEGTVEILNTGDLDQKCTLETKLVNSRNLAAYAVSDEFVAPAGRRATRKVRIDVPNVELWNDEKPNLYDVSLVLKCSGQPDRTVVFRTGFRRFEIRDGKPFLNGNPIKFRGVNHLTYHPQGGMYTPEVWLRKNLDLMKRANVNAIRTHFLAPEILATICDEIGMYLLQELPFDWGTDFVHNPEWLGPGMLRFEAGVRRDRHHPAVMVWCLGNENLPNLRTRKDDGYNHLRILGKLVKTLDPTRPTMFPPPGPANKIRGILETRFGDIADTHYSFRMIRDLNETGRFENPETWEGPLEIITREQALAGGWSGTWFSSEYGIFNYQPDLMNSPYLSILTDEKEDALSGKNTLQAFHERLKREWNYMRDDERCLGGAYFPWLCAGVGDPWGWVRWGEDADWGVVTSELLPKPAFWAMREIFSPVQFPERVAWQKGQREIEFEIHNRYNSIDFRDCELRVMTGGGPPYMGQMRSWRKVELSAKPGATARVRAPLWVKRSIEALEEGLPCVMRCVFLDPSGFRPIMADVLVIPEKIGDKEDVMPVGPDAQM